MKRLFISVGYFLFVLLTNSCTLYEYRPKVKTDDFYAQRLPASSHQPILIESSEDELYSDLSQDGRKVHFISIEPEYFRTHMAEVISEVKGHLFELDNEENIVFIQGDLVTLNKISAIAHGYGLDSFYATKNPKVKPKFLFYVTKVYILKDDTSFPNLQKFKSSDLLAFK